MRPYALNGGKKMANAYKQAGVDIEAGYESVKRMKKHVERTKRAGLLSGLGSFGGMFDLSSLNMKEPVLISGTDGVGTKLMISFLMEKYDTIGIDAVAMCVNDIVVHGAEPIFFLDYLALGKAVPEKVEQIVKGVADGCEMSGCALIGGETAEMPDMYSDDEFDIAGFAVGAVEKANIITGEKIQEGDLLVGLSSSGIHSNGYSLVRKIINDQDLDLSQTYEGFSQSLGNLLLTPTRIYAQQIGALIDRLEVKGISHITGGGFYENFPRMLPEDLGVELDQSSWEAPYIFHFIQQRGNISEQDMYGVFNMGIGMAVVVAREDVEQALTVLKEQGENASVIGKVVAKKGVHFTS